VNGQLQHRGRGKGWEENVGAEVVKRGGKVGGIIIDFKRARSKCMRTERLKGSTRKDRAPLTNVGKDYVSIANEKRGAAGQEEARQKREKALL